MDAASDKPNWDGNMHAKSINQCSGIRLHSMHIRGVEITKEHL